MYNAADIKYSIKFLGSSGEETVLYKKEKGQMFIFGNDNDIIVDIIDITDETVTLKFSGLNEYLSLPNEGDTIQLKPNKKIYLLSKIDPAPSYCIEILKIEQCQRLYFN